LGSGHILKTNPTDYAATLNVLYERKKGDVDNCKLFGLRNKKVELTVAEVRYGQSRFCRKK
jgi:hypothetical protein